MSIDQEKAAADIERAGQAALRMMAGAVPRSTQMKLQELWRDSQSDGEYPWREVIDLVLEHPVPDRDLLRVGLVAQRDWVRRVSERRAVGAGARKSAKVIINSVFLGIYTVFLIAFLVLLERRWPECDLYRAFDWLG